ncbi:MAG TPA: ATP synthase F1 subunit delta [Firmicutes bacterium]|nr:ATP synthase F1 subunit delta [Bacillota bacterium]
MSNKTTIIDGVSKRYAVALAELKIDPAAVMEAAALAEKSAELTESMTNPSISLSEKYRAIDRIFSEDISAFIKVLCKNDDFHRLSEIAEACRRNELKTKNIAEVRFEYAVRPSDEQLKKIKSALIKKFDLSDVVLNLNENENLIGGYRMTIGDKVYDKSAAGAYERMRAAFTRR